MIAVVFRTSVSELQISCLGGWCYCLKTCFICSFKRMIDWLIEWLNDWLIETFCVVLKSFSLRVCKISCIYIRPVVYVLGFWPTILLVVPLAHCVVCLRLSVVCLKEQTENQGQKVDFWVADIFLFPQRRPFLPYFCTYSPAISTRWYKWTF